MIATPAEGEAPRPSHPRRIIASYAISFLAGAASFHVMDMPPLLKRKTLSWGESSSSSFGRKYTESVKVSQTPRIDGDGAATVKAEQGDPPPFRFPYVEERIQYYMGGWDGEMRGGNSTSSSPPPPYPYERNLWVFDGGAHPGVVVLDLHTVSRCVDGPNKKRNHYCSGVLPMLVEPTVGAFTSPLSRRAGGGRRRQGEFMVMARFGDNTTDNPPLPMLVKARKVRGEEETGENDGGGGGGYRDNILWPLNVDRHYGELFDDEGKNRLLGVPWEAKRDALVWRGSATGKRLGIIENLLRCYYNDSGANALTQADVDVDVAFKGPKGGKRNQTVRDRIDALVRPRLAISDMVRYRYLLSIQGNDVASGLKWMLYSNSVVFMSPPTKVSWAMEDRLVPFVHYVPLKDDHSNLREMLAWARGHEEECVRISERATEYVSDLVMSDGAGRDNKAIMNAMRVMYQERYGTALYEYCQRHSGRGGSKGLNATR